MQVVGERLRIPRMIELRECYHHRSASRFKPKNRNCQERHGATYPSMVCTTPLAMRKSVWRMALPFT